MLDISFSPLKVMVMGGVCVCVSLEQTLVHLRVRVPACRTGRSSWSDMVNCSNVAVKFT